MHIAYVNLFVSDLERAVAFYEGTLGLARTIRSRAWLTHPCPGAPSGSDSPSPRQISRI